MSGAPCWVWLIVVPVLAWAAMFLLAWGLSALIAAFHYYLPERWREPQNPTRRWPD